MNYLRCGLVYSITLIDMRNKYLDRLIRLKEELTYLNEYIESNKSRDNILINIYIKRRHRIHININQIKQKL